MGTYSINDDGLDGVFHLLGHAVALEDIDDADVEE